jgi:hypothetical protein
MTAKLSDLDMGDNGNDKDKGFFPVDGDFIQMLPKAGASFKHEDASERPTLETIDGKLHLVFRMRSPQQNPLSAEGQKIGQEYEPTRSLPLENFSKKDLQILTEFYQKFDFGEIIAQGLCAALEKVNDRKVQQAFLAYLTFLNPMHVSIALYLYRAMHEQGGAPIVYFECNDLLDELYGRYNDGTFSSEVRRKLNQALRDLHRFDIHCPDPDQDPNASRERTLIRNILRIESYEIDKHRLELQGGTFDFEMAADFTRKLPDAYTVSLGFYKTIQSGGNYILLPKNINLKQPDSLQAARNYKMKLQTYLWWFIETHKTEDYEYFHISLTDIIKHLELRGRNNSRKKSVVWEVINELQSEGIILECKEIVGSRRQVNIQFRLNPEKITRKRA